MALPALDTATYFILIAAIINTVFSFTLVIFLFGNFLRKRTVGTFMLLLSYLFFTATSIVSIVQRILFITNGSIMDQTVYMLASLGPLVLLPAFGYLYLFACRHILKDNEILRLNIFAMIILFFGIAASVISYDILGTSVSFHLLTDTFYTNPLVFTSLVQVTPFLYTISYHAFVQITQIIVSIYITGRIGWRSLRLARKSDQPVRKRGLQTIGIGVILYLFGGMLSAFDAQVSGIPALMITIAVIRSFAFSAAYVMMYLGWIMPTWFRKMIRKRSWFEIQYQQLTKS